MSMSTSPPATRVTCRNLSSYTSDMSGKRGPSRSSLGPWSGLRPVRLMWSEMLMSEPGRRSSLTAPAAFVSTTMPAPAATAVLTPKTTSSIDHPS